MPARDRRAGVERTIELSRWMVLIFAAVANNFPGLATGQSTAAVNLVLGAWGVFNLAATVMLLANRIPGRRLQVATIVLDLAVASGLVYLTGGYNSDLAVTFFIVVIASSLRFGLVGSMACAFVAGAAYFVVGFNVANHHLNTALVDALVSRLFLLFVVALSSNLLSRELVGERDAQVRRSIELEHAAFAELREVDRIKSEFMMLASHELRTPLTKIKAWLTLMHDAGDRLPQDARDEGLHELRLEAEHLARLTDNLLCIAQLELGEIRLKTAAVDLENVFREVIARFVESADHDRFAITVAPDAQRVLADHERLALVVACLIDNALKFSPELGAGACDHLPSGEQGARRGQGQRPPHPRQRCRPRLRLLLSGRVAAPPSARWVRCGSLPRTPAGRADGRQDLDRQLARTRQHVCRRAPGARLMRCPTNLRLQLRKDGQRVRNRRKPATTAVLRCANGHVWRGRPNLRNG